MSFTLERPRATYCVDSEDPEGYKGFGIETDYQEVIRYAKSQWKNDWKARIKLETHEDSAEPWFIPVRNESVGKDMDLHLENYKTMTQVAEWVKNNLPDGAEGKVLFRTGLGYEKGFVMGINVKNRWSCSSLFVNMPHTHWGKTVYKISINNSKGFEIPFRGDWVNLLGDILSRLNQFEQFQATNPVRTICACNTCGKPQAAK
jgi:hypothetical protein